MSKNYQQIINNKQNQHNTITNFKHKAILIVLYEHKNIHTDRHTNIY